MNLKVVSIALFIGILIGCFGMYGYMFKSLSTEFEAGITESSEYEDLRSGAEYYSACRGGPMIIDLDDMKNTIKAEKVSDRCTGYKFGVIDTLKAYGMKCKDIRNGFLSSEIYSALGNQQAGGDNAAEGLIKAYSKTGACIL